MAETALLHAEIERRCRALFERLAAGDDAPPAQRLRLEGLLEAAVLLGASPEDLQADMNRLHRSIFHRNIDAALGDGWAQVHPFPEIPVFMRRAPVRPGAGE